MLHNDKFFNKNLEVKPNAFFANQPPKYFAVQFLYDNEWVFSELMELDSQCVALWWRRMAHVYGFDYIKPDSRIMETKIIASVMSFLLSDSNPPF